MPLSNSERADMMFEGRREGGKGEADIISVVMMVTIMHCVQKSFPAVRTSKTAESSAIG